MVARSEEEEEESGVWDEESGEAFEGGYCGFVSKLAGRLRDVPKLALLGLGGFKEAYAYFGEVSMMPYLRLG